MSAPSIPNLNTLRRGGLRRGGRGGASTAHAQSTTSKDDIIRNTDNDAATLRLSAVEAGYLQDDFARLFFSDGEVVRRLPLMNRGTYVRTTAIDKIVETFLTSKATRRKQIVSLGAGSDTRYFRLKQFHSDLDLIYHEVDFAANTRSKIARIRTPQFAARLKQHCSLEMDSPAFEILEDGTRLRSPHYCIHPQDLRHLTPNGPSLPDVDPDLPTLLISECCLIYLPPDKADAVLQHFTTHFDQSTPLAIVVYEPIRPFDSFGRTMVSNLTARGIHLQTLEKYADLTQQKRRLEDRGYAGVGGGAQAADVDFIWKGWVAESEKERVDGLEWMDEVEEFVLLAQHYCIAWGWRGFEDDSKWRGLPAP